MGKPRLWSSFVRRGSLMGCAAAVLLALTAPVSAQQIVPPDFFSRIPAGAGGQMAVSADAMVFNEASATVVAQGRVGISFSGYRATADRAVYYQRSGRVELIGNVAFIDPEGVEYIADRIDLEDGFKQGFLQALTVAFPDGTYFSAAETSFDEGVERIYVDGVYAPCGTCIDANGNTIGWKVKAARIITDETDNTIYFEQPSLELLGVSVLWLPWLSLPADEDIDVPLFSYDQNYGIGVSLPFFRQRIAGGLLRLTPSIFSRQGVQLALDWRQRIENLDYRISAYGIYQLDPGAYNGLADRNFRGAVQTSGTFRPTDEWTLGWSYTTFTDPGYLPDYRIATGTARNEVYGQYLDGDTYADMRVQQFVPLGSAPSNWTAASHQAASDRQALTHPNARFETITDLDDGMGRVALSGKLLGLTRAADHQSGLFNGQRYTYGYEGQAVHGMVQGSWTNQYIVPGGLAVSPYLGLRLDAADYNGASALPGAPAAQTLLSATPIAALDIRYPLMARTTGATHVIEPIAQLVYREGPSNTGIVNNDAQSTVLDTSNIFSFNRFSGADRQETGLRANVGVALQTSFDNGAWIAASVGQSHQIAGVNAFGVTDSSTAGIGAGLDTPSSYVVASVEGAVNSMLSGGLRVQYDPLTGTIPSTNMRATASHDGYSVSGTYAWADTNPALGVISERHDVGVNVTIPVMDYWRVRAGTSYDLVNNQLLTTTAALEYDDRYLAFGLGTRLGGPVSNWGNDFRLELSFRLRAAGNRDIVDFGYSWDGE